MIFAFDAQGLRRGAFFLDFDLAGYVGSYTTSNPRSIVTAPKAVYEIFKDGIASEIYIYRHANTPVYVVDIIFGHYESLGYELADVRRIVSDVLGYHIDPDHAAVEVDVEMICPDYRSWAETPDD